MFVDEVIISVKAGDGGNGCMAFRREKFVPRGGPSGGDGGRGGDVTLVASPHHNTLLHFRFNPEHKAERGRHGEGSNRSGRAGASIELPVPVGTIAWDAGSGRQLHDFTVPGERFTIAHGGRGGRGNQHFATSTHQAPTRHEPGKPGDELRVRLELKLLADAGLVGFPNAGKSTFISRISAARPKVAYYPFTTLEPVLGVVRADEERSFVVSDLPGLIEGAHAGKGLGLRFLRHVERTVVLLHMLDVSAAAEARPARALEVVLKELASYSTRLLDRPCLVAGNKLDAADPERLREAREASESRGWEFFPISAVSGEGVPALVWRLAEMVEGAHRKEGPETPDERTVYTYDPRQELGFRVVREEEGFYVLGERVEGLVHRLDLGNPQALAYVQGCLKKMGVEEELLRHGALEGDTVVIGDYVFDFLPET